MNAGHRVERRASRLDLESSDEVAGAGCGYPLQTYWPHDRMGIVTACKADLCGFNSHWGLHATLAVVVHAPV
jgi:hypothetical protein